MALPHLTDEQIRTWTRLQKDRWWLENVYRGDMPQLTVRAAVSGFLLGGLLAATNLYVGAKTGWTLGVGVTSVILAYALFRTLSQFGGSRFTILENNAVQSVATAAGYMTAPLISSLGAFMVMTNHLLPWWQISIWMMITSTVGVLVAFPMKRRFINDEQQPFPEGRACAVVLDSLYSDAPPGGTRPVEETERNEAAAAHARWLGELKARSLFGAAAFASVIGFLQLDGYQRLIQERMLGMSHVYKLPEQIFGWLYTLAETTRLKIPNILGTDLRQLAINPAFDLTMFGAGGLMGVRIAGSLLVGCLANWFVLAPILIWWGEIPPKPDGTFGRTYLLNTWCLWWGVAIMVTGSITSLFAKPELLITAVRGALSRGGPRTEDPVAHIELPVRLSFIGVPIMVAISVFLNWYWFGINPLLGFLAIPLILLLTLIAANATALTSTTPTGALSKITQFTFGALDPSKPATNLITAGMTAEVASNASNLLMDIKPGYMLGAKPRQQAVGHMIGIVSGGIAASMLFFVLFLPNYDASKELGPQLMTDAHAFPAIDLWRGVAELIATGASHLQTSAVIAMAVAAVLGILFEVARVVSHGKFWLSPVGIGLGVVIPVDSTLMMFAGALFFSWMAKRQAKKPEGSLARGLWVDSQEPLAAGVVAGAALTGIGGQLITVFVFGGG